MEHSEKVIGVAGSRPGASRRTRAVLVAAGIAVSASFALFASDALAGKPLRCDDYEQLSPPMSPPDDCKQPGNGNGKGGGNGGGKGGGKPSR